MSKLPKVSYIVTGYQHAPYVRDAIASALAQDYPNIEFLFSDDASPDDTRRIMEELAGLDQSGRPISVLQPPVNLGLSRHLAFILARATGDIFVFQSADDIAYPRRTSELVKTFLAGSQVKMVMSNVRVINREGREIRPQYAPSGTAYSTDKVAVVRAGFPWIVGASEAIRREVIADFEPVFYADCWEDFVFAFRSTLLGQVCFCDQVLLDWRHHDSNMSQFTELAGGEASRLRFISHFLKNLRSHITYHKQHLIDLDAMQPRLCPLIYTKIKKQLLEKIATKRIELAARRSAGAKIMAVMLCYGFRLGLPLPWLFRQTLIWASPSLYFRVLYRRVCANSHQTAR